jgi:7-carboxy-7-deazaguanine synthase
MRGQKLIPDSQIMSTENLKTWNEGIPGLKQQLPLMESFYTLQGEGFHQGRAAYFIRLAGCDVGCIWCDVKESWDRELHPLVSVEEIVIKAIAESFPQSGSSSPAPAGAFSGMGKIAVITGGEPLMHDCSLLTDRLRQSGFYTHLETSGAYPLSGSWDWICFSPKKFKAPLPEILSRADELKVIIFNESDFQWAEKYADQVSSTCKLYLQPEWERSDRVTPLIIDYIKRNPRFEFSLQLHKYIQVL